MPLHSKGTEMTRANDGNSRPTRSGPNVRNDAVSVERRAALEPRLAALLADFAKLDALIQPETEPAMTPDLEGYARE